MYSKCVACEYLVGFTMSTRAGRVLMAAVVPNAGTIRGPSIRIQARVAKES